MSESTAPSRLRVLRCASLAALLASGSLVGPLAAQGTRGAPPFTISTDRPSISATPSLVPAGRWLMESGVTVGFGNLTEEFVQLPEIVLRRGLAARLEATLALPAYRSQETSALGGSGAGPRRTGYTDPAIALRIGVVEAEAAAGLLPTLALLVGTSVPIGETFSADGAQPAASVMAGWALTPRLGLLANAGATRSTDGTVVPRLSGLISAALGPRAGLFVETAIQRPGEGWERPLLSLGFTQLVGPRTQLDLFTRRIGASGDHIEFGAGLSVAR